jgi:hypothetical protein
MMGKEKKEGKWFCMGTWKSSGAGAPLDALISSAHQISPSKARSSDCRAEHRYFQGALRKKKIGVRQEIRRQTVGNCSPKLFQKQ